MMNMPLALYVHLPWCLRKYLSCDFNSHALRDELPEDTKNCVRITKAEIYYIWIMHHVNEQVFLSYSSYHSYFHFMILQIPEKKYVVIRFSGSSREANLSKYVNLLESYTSKNMLTVTGQPIFAFYNPPREK